MIIITIVFVIIDRNENEILNKFETHIQLFIFSTLSWHNCHESQCFEGSFGFLYTLDIQPKGQFELEQRIDHSVDQATGSYELTQFSSEIGYGLTNDVQIAGYLNSTRIHASKN